MYIEQTPLKAIERCRHNKNSLLLVDLDAIDFTLHENALHLLETVERDLKTSSIPLVGKHHQYHKESDAYFLYLQVCSNDDSAQFMLDCLQAGAVDYLLKPIYSNVIKTLFLVKR